MEKLLTDLAGNSPVAVAMLIAFWMFNKANERRDREHEFQANERLKQITEMAHDCHIVQQRGVDAIARNTELIGRGLSAIEKFESKLGH